MTLPHDYESRVYAGILGKIIGVYLGRPFENWTHERIEAELGHITGYVHKRLGVPLVVPDDDITGTFTFLRALADHGYSRDLTPREIGETWLNYLVEDRTILWWGGVGNSTEHTAFMRLKAGVPAPKSGSAALNGKVMAEQIGAQIFIDGWGMVAPGDPEFAAELAGRAASVSHDGEAVYAAQALAAMEALAFIEPDLNKLLDVAQEVVPPDSTIALLYHELRERHATEPDWRKTLAWIEAKYGGEPYGGLVHVVPNHALVLLGLLYGEDVFGTTLSVTATVGRDTDCNAGNVGCLMGIKNGLAGMEGNFDWRGPVADRLYLPTADGGRAITDALTEAFHVANAGRRLAGLEPLAPKGGARFHFSLPGSVQGFQAEGDGMTVLNTNGPEGRRLTLRFERLQPDRTLRAFTPTFVPPYMLSHSGYGLMASPSLHPGQSVRAALRADATNLGTVEAGLSLRAYGPDDALVTVPGPTISLAPDAQAELSWTIPEVGGGPIAEVAVELTGAAHPAGDIHLDWLTWDGVPSVRLTRPDGTGDAWRRAWVNAMDHFEGRFPEAFRLAQDSGLGLIMQGGPAWTDYRASATITPQLAASFGIAVRVQGLGRYYALQLVRDGQALLVKRFGTDIVLARRDLAWLLGKPYHLELEADGFRLRAWADGKLLFDLIDEDATLTSGAVALLCETGCVTTDAVEIMSIGTYSSAFD